MYPQIHVLFSILLTLNKMHRGRIYRPWQNNSTRIKHHTNNTYSTWHTVI